MRGVILDGATLGKDVSLGPLMNLLNWQIFESTHPSQTLERIQGAEIVLSNKVVINREHMSQVPSLRYIGVLATGVNNIDRAAASDFNIQVQNVSDYCSSSLSQHWLASLLALAGSIVPYTNDVKGGRWSKSEVFCRLDHPIVPLEGANLLIVGYGTLGKAVASIAQNALNMNILIAQRPNLGTDKKSQAPDGRVSFEEGLAMADVVSLHCPLTRETENLMNHKRLGLMKKGAFLINTARGGLIVENDLIKALRSNHLGGAALDVLPEEPPLPNNVLAESGLSNLIVTPHIAWASREGRQNLINIAASHLKRFLDR